MKKGYLFEELTWHEVNDAVRGAKVAVVPVGMIEDHGAHLPVDTDAKIAEAVCHAAAERIPEEVVVLPTVKYAYSPHHMDFPGTVSVPPLGMSRNWGVLVEYLSSITCSLAHQGFTKILIVNGHGSNRPLIDLAGRVTILEYPNAQCGSISWWEIESVQEAFEKVLESSVSSHAGEVETSLYLAIDPDLVYMDRAERDLTFNASKHFWSNLISRKPGPNYRNPVHMNDFWSMDTENGVKGDPTVASKEKGVKILEAAAEELAEIIKEFRAREIGKRKNHLSR